MNPEVKRKWVEALRSGKYKQGKERLCDKDNNFCCLGVLCDIYLSERNDEWENTSGIDKLCYGLSCYPPPEVRNWAGLDYRNPHVKVPCGPDGTRSLGVLNDDCNYTFEQIADLIEEQL